MRSHAQRAEILDLVAQGVNDCEISRQTGVPRTTVRDIRRPRTRRRDSLCPRCWTPARRMLLTDERYGELLGLYLGDGCISGVSRTHSLRISLDARYPGVVADTRQLLDDCFPQNPVRVVRADVGATAVVVVYSRHLPCLFPQHGPGAKHRRPIVLENWQLSCLRSAPWRFLRGCFRSDGCAFVNRTGRYGYLSYGFGNRSADILDLYCLACDLVGVEYRRYEESVRIYRRASVALFKANVGFKF